MKKTNIFYWIVTILFGGFMIFSAIPDILVFPEAVKIVTDLGYPLYFIPFIGVAKLLGSITILIPGMPRLKEWAYAGLVYDLIAAGYSQYNVNFQPAGLVFMVIFLGLAFSSYFLYHKRLKARLAVA